MNDIFTIANTHFEKFRQDGYASIQEWLQTDSGNQSLKFDPIHSSLDIASLLEKNYDKYISAMKDGVSMAENALKTNGILYRIYDIHTYEETAGSIVCKWIIQNKEYACAIFANIEHEPYLRVGYSHGELIINVIDISNTETPLPKWFVDGLKNSYC